MIVDRHAKDFAVINRRSAPVKSRPRDTGFDLGRCAPDLPAGLHIDGKRPLAVDGVHDAVVNGRLCELALIVHHARVPDRHQPLDVGLVDLLERAITLSVIAHAVSENVFRILAVDQLLHRLGQHRRRPQSQQRRT